MTCHPRQEGFKQSLQDEVIHTKSYPITVLTSHSEFRNICGMQTGSQLGDVALMFWTCWLLWFTETPG
jgi:hypothetical protein